MRRRVVITGMGAITPLGHNVRETIEAQLHGKNGVGPIQSFNAQRFPTKFAAQVKNFDLLRFIPDGRRWAHSGINSQFAAVAAQEALQHAGLLDDQRVDRNRFGVYLGSGEGIQDFHNLLVADLSIVSPRDAPARYGRFRAGHIAATFMPNASPSKNCTRRRPIWPLTSICAAPITTA